MSVVTRKYMPLALALGAALITFGAHYIDIPFINAVTTELEFDGTMLAAFLVTLGAIGMIIKNARDISRRSEGKWYYSIWLLILFAVMLVVGLLYTQTSESYIWLYGSFANPILATQYGLCGFYIILAVYRTFRIRSVESAIFVVAALITLWNQMPIGEYFIPLSRPIADWLNNTLNVAVNRGFIILGAIGSVMLGIRVLMGYEKALVPET